MLNKLNIILPLDLYLGNGMYLFPNFINYPVSRRSQSFTWIHDLSFEKFPKTVSPKLQKNFHKNVGKWIKRSTKVITLSNFIKSEIQEVYSIDSRKVEVVYCGVNTKHFYKRNKSEINSVKKKYNLPENYILHIGNIEPRKNLELFLYAYASIKNELTQKYGLVLIGGNGWNNSQTYAVIDELKAKGINIVLPRQYVTDKDLPAIISGATVAVSPSLYEGFGMTPLESLACGTKTLVSDIPTHREIYGDSVLKFDPRNINDMAISLEGILLNKTKVTHSQIVEEYTWSSTVDRLIKIISES
ncbi:MAG: glycosyltransferase family 1 protein [Patescibacteria group bacterium]